MKIVFIHQNFPGQYLHLAQSFKEQGHDVLGIGEAQNIKNRGHIKGITTIGYPTPVKVGENTHHYLKNTETAVRRGQAVARSLLRLKEKGYRPDVICVHPGWGEGLFLRDIFPETPLLMFCEYYFRADEADSVFDPEFPLSLDFKLLLRINGSVQISSLLTANALICPTTWQASRYPECFRSRMQITHDGVNTKFMYPDASDSLTIQPLKKAGESRVVASDGKLPGGGGWAEGDEPEGAPLTFRAGDKVITFLSRNLEPYRGFHTFMRALPELQRRHPDAHVLIGGVERSGYSIPLPDGESYKARYLAEVAPNLDMTRVHFLGLVPYPAMRSMFRISSAHVYLTYPFVLSWSVLEAMSCECLLVASNTEPVTEVVTDNKEGLLVDFFDREALVNRLDEALSEPERFVELRKAARRRIIAGYDLDFCLQAQAKLINDLAAGKYPPPR